MHQYSCCMLFMLFSLDNYQGAPYLDITKLFLYINCDYNVNQNIIFNIPKLEQLQINYPYEITSQHLNRFQLVINLIASYL